ncbi:MAG: 2-amino-4-hydroxy-6-hydroxymethyldihydropteridine diphosphokinase [Leptospiraceae bacterium]|nr:2-amino-4-hydroxy-6-hydroxymethyldihydropteridine diphosphokinase [Leptospiraceae bacterium]
MQPNMAFENLAIVSCGSNIEPENNKLKALDILKKEQRLLDISQFRYTDPVGFLDQPDFLNGAVYIATSLDFANFNNYLKEVELRLGRIKGPNKAGPRTMDLDIIIWNNKIVHDDYQSRDYVKIFVDELIEKNSLRVQ